MYKHKQPLAIKSGACAW